MVSMKLKNLRKSYEDACNMWLRELCISWELRGAGAVWVISRDTATTYGELI